MKVAKPRDKPGTPPMVEISDEQTIAKYIAGAVEAQAKAGASTAAEDAFLAYLLKKQREKDILERLAFRPNQRFQYVSFSFEKKHVVVTARANKETTVSECEALAVKAISEAVPYQHVWWDDKSFLFVTYPNVKALMLVFLLTFFVVMTTIFTSTGILTIDEITAFLTALGDLLENIPP